MWEEGAHIYGTPGVPNNFPSLEYYSVNFPKTLYHKTSLIFEIKFFIFNKLSMRFDNKKYVNYLNYKAYSDIIIY